MTPDWRDAAARAVDNSVARAKVCTECGRIEALGHFALCPIGESVPPPAKAQVYAEWITANVVTAYGQCQKYAEAMVAAFPELRLARGWYDDLLWGARQHWWCVAPDGRVIDPTVSQFPGPKYAEAYREITDESEIPTGICMVCGDACYEGRPVCCESHAREIEREYGAVPGSAAAREDA
ncbi:MAG TPA: hypothetical protein VNT52_10925 [Acidimicrobiales bacterium]|nr:hypothetical protein [Acidimicrobiales bacterium]